jgi:hypothetical protein
MLKKFTLVVATLFLLGGCSFGTKRSGVEIISYPSALVYIDGKEMGSTPYKNNSLKPGQIDVKLVSGSMEWQRKIHLENSANTVVNWEFGQNGKDGDGYVLYLEQTGDQNKAGFMVNSIPDKAAIEVDGEIKALSPTKIEDLGEGDKQIKVSFPSYKNVIVFVKAMKGYQLILEAELAKEPIVLSEPTGTGTTESPIESSLKPTGTQVWLTIKETGTGWLRVRDSASGEGVEVRKVNTGEKYKYLESNDGWYKIDLGNGSTGWVSAKYVDKSE